MKAIVMDRYGGPEVLRLAEVEKPVPKDNEVLIRIHATVATPPDVAFRSARPFIVRFFTGLLRPKYRVMGTSLAGVVEATGSAVTRYQPGASTPSRPVNSWQSAAARSPIACGSALKPAIARSRPVQRRATGSTEPTAMRAAAIAPSRRSSAATLTIATG